MCAWPRRQRPLRRTETSFFPRIFIPRSRSPRGEIPALITCYSHSTANYAEEPALVCCHSVSSCRPLYVSAAGNCARVRLALLRGPQAKSTRPQRSETPAPVLPAVIREYALG